LWGWLVLMRRTEDFSSILLPLHKHLLLPPWISAISSAPFSYIQFHFMIWNHLHIYISFECVVRGVLIALADARCDKSSQPPPLSSFVFQQRPRRRGKRLSDGTRGRNYRESDPLNSITGPSFLDYANLKWKGINILGTKKEENEAFLKLYPKRPFLYAELLRAPVKAPKSQQREA